MLLRSIKGTIRECRRSIQTHIGPPTHFSSKHAPPNYNELSNSNSIEVEVQRAPETQERQKEHEGDKPIREFSSLLAMMTLGYFAVDNYLNRVKLEKLNNESTSINLKTLQIQQANFAQERRKKDLQLLQERKETQRQLFKLSVHIAMLRKQLADQGYDPVNIDQALKEFEDSVKIDNSIKNISGQVLWLDKTSDLRRYLPDIHDYEKKSSK
ncbi:hypothetical protein PSN45_000611 [Yamadazyma tenuis]|uniref:Uncharacterized protein n=1 Tax=Candida tenuis (strain ATCC 10573 / BCRC 21748 / CBS 615 / JCM 9827 / NBRC 10315 / NRRL Y-1498 / VKM Y-70) TaxID=590646 RepID=G3B9K9_CANTC|nr:uncharacterized protein CANTEDRAFT_115371 [Yamadazyma tenuis ATCC 10573]XP_006688869.1 uncharacterized protein CANTEDRAFT_115371 [Yamadazyma tenuis ATCC 10573]EGV62698.1 hypothetical protein CANTEDRAFT_115371 [Yamadazyma tenuis ATCC 10573]EGV62699.1 hypothetical protein CANTEDRAFT_115371 [Yamadazyma tenuis ATCC 10573]WEJ93150.1 hypothetical protein PSN45_000611 [Yamadazyma tenuis]